MQNGDSNGGRRVRLLTQELVLSPSTKVAVFSFFQIELLFLLLSVSELLIEVSDTGSGRCLNWSELVLSASTKVAVSSFQTRAAAGV